MAERGTLPMLHDRFTEAARQDPDRFFELGAELARAHAASLGIPGTAPRSVELLACPACGGRVLALPAAERAGCTACSWQGTIGEACQ